MWSSGQEILNKIKAIGNKLHISFGVRGQKNSFWRVPGLRQFLDAVESRMGCGGGIGIGPTGYFGLADEDWRDRNPGGQVVQIIDVLEDVLLAFERVPGDNAAERRAGGNDHHIILNIKEG